jgi:hypothetical protein
MTDYQGDTRYRELFPPGAVKAPQFVLYAGTATLKDLQRLLAQVSHEMRELGLRLPDIKHQRRLSVSRNAVEQVIDELGHRIDLNGDFDD